MYYRPIHFKEWIYIITLARQWTEIHDIYKGKYTLYAMMTAIGGSKKHHINPPIMKLINFNSGQPWQVAELGLILKHNYKFHITFIQCIQS